MIIYLLENTINGKVYIGQTINNDMKNRLARHKSDGNKHKNGINVCNTHLYGAIAKYGWENFVCHILDDSTKTIEELNKLECWWIEIFNSTNRDVGYNLHLGGNGKRCTKETRNKMSKAGL